MRKSAKQAKPQLWNNTAVAWQQWHRPNEKWEESNQKWLRTTYVDVKASAIQAVSENWRRRLVLLDSTSRVWSFLRNRAVLYLIHIARRPIFFNATCTLGLFCVPGRCQHGLSPISTDARRQVIQAEFTFEAIIVLLRHSKAVIGLVPLWELIGQQSFMLALSKRSCWPMINLR